MKELIYKLAAEFSSTSHGSSNYDQDHVYIMGASLKEFVPFSFIQKHLPEIKTIEDLQKQGFMYSSYLYMDQLDLSPWYQAQFGKKITGPGAKEIGILYFPDNKEIFEAVQIVNTAYSMLRKCHVVMNGKNLPIQMGEWYAKTIFGLRQIKSSSQRGFDFHNNQNEKVEVQVHWNDASSPKGVKLKKSLLELSNHTIIMYISKNFMIRDVLYLDSEFIIRKFALKGHTVFLKDVDVNNYFFSKSSKHLEKVVNKNSLMKFATPAFAMSLVDRL